MEDPLSPAASITGSLWEADSDTSVDSGNIYEDLGNPAASGSDSEVSDADIFQELGVVANEGEQLPSCKESFETQEKADALSNDKKKEVYQNDRIICKTTASRQDASSYSNDTTALALSQTEKEEGKKKDKAGTVIRSGTLVSENSTKNNVPPDSPNTRSKMKKLLQKEAEDSTRKQNFECQAKNRSSNGCLAEHEDGSKNGVKIKDPNQGIPLTLPMTSKNKDLEFILSRVMKNKSSAEKKEHVPPDQHSLAKEGNNLNLLVSKSRVIAQNKKTSGGNKPSSKIINGRSSSDTAMEEKNKEVQKMETNSKSCVRRETTDTEGLSGTPRTESANSNPGSLVDKIMCLAGFSQRPTAADFMTEMDTCKKYKIPKLSQVTKKSKSREEKNTQLDLFEDLLVGLDRDELLKEIEKLKTERDSLQERLHTSWERCSGLEKDNEVLLNNMSSLWKTSMAQLRQRSHELATVRREKEAIIFRRAMRQVPRDELDRIASHIAAYDKEEFAEFISKLKETEQDWEKKECVCARKTPTTRRIGSVAQRVRQAARGTRLSPSSDSEAQTLRNLLGKKGETVTHSEEKPGNWSKARHLTRSLRSQKCLFPSEGGLPEPEVSRCIWDRLGKNPLDRRRTGIEDEGKETCTEEGEVVSEKTGMESSYGCAHGSSKKPLLGEAVRGKRKSVFSRLSIKKTINNQEESASVNSDAPASDFLSVPESHLSDLEIYQEKRGKITEVKKTGTLDDKCRMKERSSKCYQSEPPKGLLSKLQVCTSRELAGGPSSTTLKLDKTGGHSSGDTTSSAQEPQDKSEFCSDDEDEMLSKTLFGQRMKRKMEKSTKPPPVTKQQKDMSPLSSPVVNQDMSPKATHHKQSAAQDKVKPVANSVSVNIRKPVFAETEEVDTVINRASDEGDMIQDVLKLDIQNYIGSVENDECEMRKKPSSAWKGSDRQKAEDTLKQGATSRAKEDKNPAEKGRENHGNIENNNVVVKETGGSHVDNSRKQVDKTKLERNESTGNRHVMENSEKMMTTECERKQDTRVAKPDWEDIDKEEIDTAILSLAKLRSAFHSQERKVKTKNKKLKKQRHLLSLFGGDDVGDKVEMPGKEACKENQETEIHRKVSRNTAASEKQVIEGDTKKKSSKPLDANRHISKEMEELLDMVENAEECVNHNTQLSDLEKKQKGKSVTESSTEYVGLDIDKEEGPKGKETSIVAHQVENSEEVLTEKVDYIDRKGRSKSLKKASVPNTEDENRSVKKELTPASGTEDNTLVHDKNTQKIFEKYSKVKRKPDEKVTAESTSRNVNQQTKERRNRDPREEDESTCKHTQSKETSSDKRVKHSKSAENENGTEVTEDSVLLSQNRCDGKKTLVMSRKDSKKKKNMSKTKVSIRSNKKSDPSTEASFSKQRGKNEGAPSQTSSEAPGSIDETNAVDNLSFKTPTMDPGAENASALNDIRDIQQQNQECDEKDNTTEEEDGGIENNPLDSKKETAAQKEANTTEAVRASKSDQATFDGLQKPVQNMKDAEYASCIKNSNESNVCAVDPADNPSKDSIGEDSQESDILKSLLGTNYDEDSLFLQEEELLYDEGSEEDEDTEEEHSVPVGSNVKKAGDGNDENESEERKAQEEEPQMKNKIDPKQHHRRDEIDKGAHNTLIRKDKEMRDADKTSSSPRSGKAKEQETRTRNKPPSDSPQGGLGNEDTLTVKKQTRGDIAPKTGEKPIHSTIPPISPPSQKGSLSKLLGGRIKKLTVSPRDKGCKSTKEGVSPLMVREGRLQESRGEKPELKTSRGEGESPRSQVKRKETPEKGHRGRKAQNSHVLLSQNRKTPPRLREGRLGSRKRERVSESDTLGKRERSPERSPRTRRERSSPRQREPLGEREQPASKRRRVSVKSRLSFPHNSDEENITRPAKKWQPSVLEVERTRTSSRHRNQSGEKRSVADSHTRELSWQDGAQHSSDKDGKHTSTSTVPVDSKLLQSVLAQSPSKLMAQGDEKEEGELDEEEEEGEDSTTNKNIKNHKTCDTEKTKVDNLKKQPEVSKGQKDVEDTDKNKFKRNSKEKQNISLDNRDMQGGKASKTDKENTLISTNKEDPQLGDAEAHIVFQNQMNNKQANQEKQSHKSGAMERENSARSSQRMTGDSKQQQTSQTKPLPSRKKSPLVGALQDHVFEKPRKDGKGALEHSSNIEEEDHKCKRSCAPMNENVLRKKLPLLESLQNQEIEKVPEHSPKTEEDQKHKGRNCTPVNKNVLRKKSPLLEALQDQEIKKPNRDGRGALKHSSRIEDQKCKRRSCAPMDENATFYPGDLYQAMQAKAKSQLLKDTSASSISSVSDDTIDLMVRQHNENFSDITNGSDDSETSLLKYIADDNDDNNGDDESEEEEEIQVCDISTLKEDMAHSSGERENGGEIHCKDGRKQAGMQNNVTPCGDESETMQDAEKRSTQEHGDVISMDPISPHHRNITRVPMDECESDDESSSPASPESTAGISERNPPTAVSMMQHSDSEEEEGSREQNIPTPVSVIQNSDSEEEGHGNQNTRNTPTPVSVTQHSDSEEEEGSREQNTPAPVSVTQHSDSEEEEGSGEQNTPTPVSVTQHSSSEEEEGSGEQNTPTPVSVTQHSDSEEEGGSGEQGNPTPVSVTQHSESEAEKGSGGLGLSAAIGFLPDSSEEDSLSSSEESELDVETVDSEPEHTGKEIQQSSLYGNRYGNISVDDQLSSTRQNEDDTELVTEPLDEDRLTTETENIDNNSSSSDESDSDSDCQCSDCNKSNSSSSSSSNSSSGSDSSSSISSDSEVDDTVLDGAENVGRPKHTGEDSKESYGQASNQSYGEPPTEAAYKPKSPNKAGHKSPKKTPKKTPSRTSNTKLGASQISTTPFKKTPRKSPCKKTPCKKSPLKKAQGKTPKKGKRVLASSPAASPVKEPQDTSLTSPGVDNEASDNTRIVSPPNTQQDPDVETPHGSRLIKHPGSPGKTQHKSAIPPLSDSGSSVSKSRQRQVTPLSDSCISQSFQLKEKISPLDSSFSISKTYHLKRRVSPVKTMNAVPSMPFIETDIVPLKGRSASFASSPSRTMKLSCTDTTPVISVVHSSMGDESQAPQRAAIKTPKKVTQEVNVTTPANNKPVAARKRQRSPNSVLLITRNIKGKRMRTLSPSMYDRVSPRKLFSATTNVKQKTAITAPSSSESCLGTSANNVKTSVSKEIVVPVTIRRAKRQLNLQLSSSPVQHFSFSSMSHQEDTTTPAGQREGGSKGQVLRKSPRKPKRLTKQNW